MCLGVACSSLLPVGRGPQPGSGSAEQAPFLPHTLPARQSVLGLWTTVAPCSLAGNPLPHTWGRSNCPGTSTGLGQPACRWTENPEPHQAPPDLSWLWGKILCLCYAVSPNLDIWHTYCVHGAAYPTRHMHTKYIKCTRVRTVHSHTGPHTHHTASVLSGPPVTSFPSTPVSLATPRLPSGPPLHKPALCLSHGICRIAGQVPDCRELLR